MVLHKEMNIGKDDLIPVQEVLKEFKDELLSIERLPYVLTNNDLKNMFQVSDSTLNRLIKLTDFPPCWYGVRGHYLRDDVLAWLERRNYEAFIEEMKLLRSV
ncbi:helix-turn-helix domain-containing protein [Tetragenococcus koreensis]|uniref:DNA-binding protein n=1 Tax=Tetragenococcus koreensis TaxID=290335 RepID=A0AAN4UBZ0_9ENTE|nr:helix-turn-helix domain-containing protein [Tetragenococcus koreensis]GEQ49633.1 DNA-binding protein [Tetragenococcus koreensis]GEQ52079.1 DNA-binding protein [Tetragenococcus koreensis]GEQ54614.1 DNA-binding protein [Tetragenococcus koreensis]GEQ57106.1 DNA-binding protein [Tetragenococcus koreensis]GEQ59646.1 DNA-binding protein [Tetragenococcus koreensis]